MARGAISVGLSMVGVLLLGGCTGPAEAGPTPSVVAQETGTPEPGPTATPGVAPVTAPVRPAEMERSDEVGAAAAAEYFLRLFPYVMQSGDLEEWALISTTDCEFCSTVRGWVEDFAAADEDYAGGDVTVAGVHVFPQDAVLGGYTVQLEFTQADARVAGPDGVVTRSVEAYGEYAFVDVIRSQTGWVLVELVTREEPLA